MKYVIFFDPDKCLGCKSCEIACAVAHSASKNLTEAIEEFPVPQQRIQLEDLKGSPVPILCKHCEAAPCVQVCPTDAIRKYSNGPVVVDPELCVGCSSCVIVCPWGVPRLDRDRKVMIKCDFCMEQVEEGGEPACVSACPSKALTFKFVEELVMNLSTYGEKCLCRTE